VGWPSCPRRRHPACPEPAEGRHGFCVPRCAGGRLCPEGPACRRAFAPFFLRRHSCSPGSPEPGASCRPSNRLRRGDVCYRSSFRAQRLPAVAGGISPHLCTCGSGSPSRSRNFGIRNRGPSRTLFTLRDEGRNEGSLSKGRSVVNRPAPCVACCRTRPTPYANGPPPMAAE
jgi:hypothetical protein